MKTLFFGGSFDPPHLGHLAVAQGAAAAGCGDLILWVPAFAPPHKPDSVQASFADRMQMVKLLIADFPQMAVSDIESRLSKKPSYTIDTLEQWERENNERPGLLIGSDSLLNFHTWKDCCRLVDNYDIFTYPRKCAMISADHLRRFWDEKRVEKLLSGVIPGKFFEISSSEVRFSMEKNGFRDNIKERTDLTPEISGFIREKKLYTAQTDRPANNN